MDRNKTYDAIGFIALTSGARPKAMSVKSAVGFGEQAALILATTKKKKFPSLVWGWDHSTNRKVDWFRRSAFLTQERYALEYSVPIIVADFSRMTARLSNERFKELLDHLETTGLCIIDGLTTLAISPKTITMLSIMRDAATRRSVMRGFSVKTGQKSGSEREHTVPSTAKERSRIASIKKHATAFAEHMRPVINEIRTEIEERGDKATLQAIADALNERGLKTRRGSEWKSNSVRRIINR